MTRCRSRRPGSRASRTCCSARSPACRRSTSTTRCSRPTLGGEEFLTPFRAAARGEAALPFVLVIEGSIPNEQINGEGYWTSFGNDEATGEPLTLNWWIDQLAPKAWGVVAIGTCATYGGIHAMAGNPTGCMGLADYLGWDFRSRRRPADRQRPRLPRPARELHGDARLAALPGGRPRARDPARRRSCARRGSSARPSTRAATAPATTSRATSRTTTTRPSAW